MHDFILNGKKFTAISPNVKILGSKAKLWTAALFIGNAIIGIMNPQISVGAAAHAVGMVAGLFCGYWIKKKKL